MNCLLFYIHFWFTIEKRSCLIISTIFFAAYSAAADDITGVIIITVVCCAVGTSAIWVIIIYQTRKRFRCTAVPKDLSSRAIHLDTKSEHSASSKDSGTGDSTKRSCDEFENGESFPLI